MGHIDNNTFTNSGSKQNIVQGDHAVDMQVNVPAPQPPKEGLLKLPSDALIWCGNMAEM